MAFRNHSNCLIACAKQDCYALAILQNKTFEIVDVSLKKLNEYPRQSFATLGFLAAVMQKAADWNNSGSWIRFYADLEAFSFRALTFKEFEQIAGPIKESFCLFLDEFTVGDKQLLIRNLARLCGLKCVVSNSNTRIADLFGPSRTGRGEASKGYSVVFNRLNTVTPKVLESSLYEVDDTIKKVISFLQIPNVCNLSTKPKERLAKEEPIFDLKINFALKLKSWILSCRPGIAVFVERLKSLDHPVNFGELLEYVSVECCK